MPQVLATVIHCMTADSIFQRLDPVDKRRLGGARSSRDNAALMHEGNQLPKPTRLLMYFSHKKISGNALENH